MNLLKKLLRIRTFTPVGFLCWAGLLVFLYGVCEFAGWREHTTFLTGTAASETDSLQMSGQRGVIYMMTYFGFVLVAPILVLAAGIFGLFGWRLRRQGKDSGEGRRMKDEEGDGGSISGRSGSLRSADSLPLFPAESSGLRARKCVASRSLQNEYARLVARMLQMLADINADQGGAGSDPARL